MKLNRKKKKAYWIAIDKSRSHDGKVLFFSKDEAQIEVIMNRSIYGDVGLSSYKCRHCVGWHIGHKKKPKFKLF